MRLDVDVAGVCFVCQIGRADAAKIPEWYRRKYMVNKAQEAAEHAQQIIEERKK